VDLHAGALDPRRAVGQRAGRLDLVEAEQSVERDAGRDLLGLDFDRYVLKSRYRPSG
jgi:hypothetical protein